MLSPQFFTFTPPEVTGSMLKTEIALVPGHQIFKGHFPGQPIVPGVCMVQMIKEVLERHVNMKLLMIGSDSIKFLSFVDPNVHTGLSLEIKLAETEGMIKADAQLMNADTKFMKFKGRFQVR